MIEQETTEFIGRRIEIGEELQNTGGSKFAHHRT